MLRKEALFHIDITINKGIDLIRKIRNNAFAVTEERLPHMTVFLQSLCKVSLPFSEVKYSKSSHTERIKKPDLDLYIDG